MQMIGRDSLTGAPAGRSIALPSPSTIFIWLEPRYAAGRQREQSLFLLH